MEDKERQEIKDKANSKALELGTQMSCKVHTLCVDKDDEVVVGYVKEPTLATKMLAVNYIAQKQLDLAGDTILMTSLLKEHSDPRFSKPSTDDDVYLSAVLACNTLVKVYASDVKKN